MNIVIIGGGFAGLKLARELNNERGYEVLLIDRFAFHQFQPLLYQLATAQISAANITFPFRKVFQNSGNVRFRIAEVLEIRTDEKMLITDIGTFSYDILVLATGTVTNFFGNAKIASLVLPMKSTIEATYLMNRIISNFEDALDIEDSRERSAIMSIAVVGAGPTGVELAGALAEMRNNTISKDYPELIPADMKITLIDHGVRPLSAMSAASGTDAAGYLEQMGVELRSGVSVKEFNGIELITEPGPPLHLRTVIWAAGIRGTFPDGIDPNVTTRGNRILVNEFSQLKGQETVYAIGDVALMPLPDYPAGHPQLASVAGSQGEHLAANLIRLKNGQPMLLFIYKDRGIMATIGKRKAVVDLSRPKMHLRGALAWLIWMSLHLFLILGAKNRLQVFVNWSYKYLTKDQNLRLVQRVRTKSLTDPY